MMTTIAVAALEVEVDTAVVAVEVDTFLQATILAVIAQQLDLEQPRNPVVVSLIVYKTAWDKKLATT